MGFYIIEARRMPFADDDLPRADSVTQFHERIRSAVRDVVKQNPSFQIASEVQRSGGAGCSAAAIDHHIAAALANTGAVLEAVVDSITREMMDLEAVYFATIDRLSDLHDEEGEEIDEEEVQDGGAAASFRPAIAMRFDESGRLTTTGTFPQAHGFHNM